METPIFSANPISEAEALAPKLAGFWSRTGAALLDGLILSPLLCFMFYNLFYLKSFGLEILVLLVMTLYKPLMEFRYGGTLGKLAIDLKVVNYDYEKISLKQAFIRSTFTLASQLLSIISSIALFMHPDFQSAETFEQVGIIETDTEIPGTFIIGLAGFISCLFVAWDSMKQALHDKMAKTYCIKK